jgi:hypothetical protein
MDGGVYDNQGVTSILLAISRRAADAGADFESDENHDPQSWAHWARDLLSQYSIVDLFIISDTPLLKNSLYSPDDHKPQTHTRFVAWLHKRKLGEVNRMAWITAIVLVASSAASFLRLWQTGQFAELKQHFSGGLFGYLQLTYEGFATLIPLAIAGLIGAVLLSLRAQIGHAAKSMENNIPKLSESLWYYLRDLQVSDLWNMMRLRAGSLMALAADIYMHRIRQLGYNLVFSHEKLAATILTNEIYSVSNSNTGDVLPPECDPVSAEVRAIVELCAGMATKGWFDPLSPRQLKKDITFEIDDASLGRIARRGDGEHRGDLDILTASGQITTCYNVIRYIRDTINQAATMPVSHTPAALSALLDRACKDWNRLQVTPFMFVDERLNAGRSPEHASQINQNVARYSDSDSSIVATS